MGLAGLGTGAGTVALFADVESSTGNSFQSGTIDLTLNGQDQEYTFFGGANAVTPGQDGTSSVTVGNDGSLPGVLEITLADVRDYENGYSRGENGRDGSPNAGELQKHLLLTVDVGDDTPVDSERLENLYRYVGSTYDQGPTIAPGSTVDVTVYWEFDSSGSNGDVDLAQSDSVETDLTFRLVQTGGA